jgi:replicative DNA helicase
MSESYLLERDHTLDSLKSPPNSIHAEQSVLGSLIIENGAWDTVADKISEVDFYLHSHKLIFRTIAQLAEQQIPFDIITLSESLKSLGHLDAVGGLSYLIVLSKDTPCATNVAAYANIVRDKSVLRQLISAGTTIANSVYQTEGQSTQELLENAEKLVFKIAEQTQKSDEGGFVGIRALAKKTIEKIELLAELDGSMTGASTGFDDLDTLTSGLQPSDLIIVAGRPSMGKTTVAMNIAENFAIKNEKPVAVFSMEMPGDAIVMRMMSSLGGIEQQRVRSGDLDDNDWPRLTMALTMLNSTKIFIDDSAALTPSEIRARARRLAREHGQLGLIVVDYLQLMNSPTSGESRVQQISDISRGLKALAKELNVPVIALSQLNRNLEQRPNKRPVMSDLRDSGAIEQDADLILFIYRDEVYNENSPDKGTAELIIGKQRNGPLGTVRLMFQGQYSRFQNCANPSHYSSYSQDD